MASGYLNRVIQLTFPELAGRQDDDDPDSPAVIWVTIRNPKLIPGHELIGKGGGTRRDEHGNVIYDERTAAETFGGYAKLIIAGYVLDPSDPLDPNPPVLPMPPSEDDVAKYPMEILSRLGEVVSQGTPR